METFNSLYKESKICYGTTTYENFNEIPVKNEVFGEIIRPVSADDFSNGVFTKNAYYDTEKEFLENYGNLFARSFMSRSTVVIDENDDKISLKLYRYESTKRAGKRYRAVRRSTSYLTFNYKKKVFYTGIVHKKKKKMRSATGYRVNVKNLNDTTVSPSTIDINLKPSYKNETEKIYSIFFSRIIEKTKLDINVSNYSSEELYILIQFKLLGIKYPDNFRKFIQFYFTKKILKKFDYNLVTWAMELMSVKGSKIRKLFNEKPIVNITLISVIYHILGIDNFNKINDDILCSTDDQFMGGYGYFDISLKNTAKTLESLLTKSEKNNLVDVINDGFTDIVTLFDHLNFKRDLLKYGEKVKIKSKTKDDFNNEHIEWSNLLGSYKNGVVERFYGDDSILLEVPFKCEDQEYFPVLLKTSDQYNEESMLQSNCVRTYSEKPYCFIVSLRKGSKDSKERLTIEYRYTKDGLRNVQTRAKYNQLPQDEWISPVMKLDDFANYLYQKDMIKLPSMVKKFPKGLELRLDAVFKKKENVIDLYPSWENDVIYNEFDYLF